MENQTEGFGTLGIALLAAIVLVYLVWFHCMTVSYIRLWLFFSIPLAMIGNCNVDPWHYRKFIEYFHDVGMIMLIGLVAKNAIMIVDFANMRKSGWS